MCVCVCVEVSATADVRSAHVTSPAPSQALPVRRRATTSRASATASRWSRDATAAGVAATLSTSAPTTPPAAGHVTVTSRALSRLVAPAIGTPANVAASATGPTDAATRVSRVRTRAFQFAIRIDSIRYANRLESIRSVKKSAFRFTSGHAVFALNK